MAITKLKPAEEAAPPVATAHMGHNRPPLAEIIPAEFRAALLADQPDFLTVLDDRVDQASRARATDEEELKRCGNLVKAFREIIAHVNATHKAVKEPYLEGGRLVDAEKNALIDRVDAAKRRVEAIGNAFVAERDAKLRAEQARAEAEQRAAAERAAAAEREREAAEQAAEQAARTATNDAERAAAEQRAAEAAEAAEAAMAEAALAPAAPARAEPIRSDEGAVISGKQEWKSEVTDYTVAFMHVEDHPRVREAIDKAVAQLVKAGKRSLDGVRIWPVAKANFR